MGTSDFYQNGLILMGQQVLLVEDCPNQGRIYLKFLQLSGAEVVLECCGQSAVDAVGNSPTRFDAVVMDFQMPEMEGITATERLRSLGYRGTIIAITAYGTDELKQSWFQAGCNEFLEKPLTRAELTGAIARHTQRRQNKPSEKNPLSPMNLNNQT